MSRSEESTNPSATALAEAERGPYTRRDEDTPAVDGAETERLRALERQISDGLNLVHLRIGEMRTDIRENRKSIAELRRELADCARAAAEDRERRSAEAAANLERTRSEFTANLERISDEAAEDRNAIRKEMAEGFRKAAEDRSAIRREMAEGFAQLREANEKLLEVATMALERSTAALNQKNALALTRRQFFLGIGLLAIGALLPRLFGWIAILLGG